MIEKKLLTLAGAAGILLCGACFLPPLPQHPPLPPPVRRGLEGVREIRVEVANVSKSFHLGVSALAVEVADIVSAQSHGKIKAHTSKEAGDGDAVLRIEISSEKATRVPGPGESETWYFEIDASATLTRSDGNVIWTATDQRIFLSEGFPRPAPADAWDDREAINRLQAVIGSRLVFPMLYGQ